MLLDGQRAAAPAWLWRVELVWTSLLHLDLVVRLHVWN